LLDRLIMEENVKAVDAQKAAAKKSDLAALQKAQGNYQRVVEQYAMSRQLAQTAVGQRDNADKELKTILDLLQKRLADLKDSDPATKKLLEEVAARLKDAIKATPRRVPMQPALPPMQIQPPVPPTPPVAPKVVAPKAGTIVRLPDQPHLF